ncbi:hypothetical protein LOZ80_20070 [Paenibacillus sp. HWE-109]|uniref:hypothetical protein n=1 Tax=Paenibacillus sp. HWE-109 TaxID=1306526 RepID=UPI001EE097FA|nr:hypothetical protein [Paenibacillus sp. HWE-109]UKS23942.1 hypothetical protein LOZ80_20070 [Paenibacillus sp. HWE-109]
MHGLDKVADILEKTAEATKWVEQFQAKAAKIKAQLVSSGKQGEAAIVAQPMNKQLYVYFENIAFTVC